MTFTPANLSLPDPVFLGPFTKNSVGSKYRGMSVTQPASGVPATLMVYHPFYVSRPYDLQRFWWQNGATVGTDTVQGAVYTADGTPECVVATPRTLSAGTANGLQFATCASIAHPVLSGTSTTDGTSFVTASTTLRARPGWMYAVIFINSKASAAEAATTVQTTSGGATFTSRVSTTYGASTEGRVSMWTCVPAADVTDTITISFSGTQTGAAWTVVAFTNADTTTNHGVVQSVTGTGNSTTPLATLAALGSAGACVIGANANVADTTTTPGSGFSELYDINYATPTNCLQVQWTNNDTTSDGTITSGQWGAIAAEVKSLGTTRILAPGRYFMGLNWPGSTATAFQQVSTTVAHLGGGMESPVGANAAPLLTTFSATVSTPYIVNCGITNRATP